MTDIIALPEMTRGLECRLRDAYDNTSAVALEHPDLIDAMEAVDYAVGVDRRTEQEGSQS